MSIFSYPVVRCMFHISLVFRCIGVCHLWFTIYNNFHCIRLSIVHCTFYTAPVSASHIYCITNFISQNGDDAHKDEIISFVSNNECEFVAILSYVNNK